MENAWRKAVRPGLRGQALLDLHDYLDVHRNIRTYANRLRADVITGRYRPAESTIMRLEKRYGICRRIVLPAPADALVLQTIIDVIERPILRRQPARSAYYARSHMPPSFERVDETFPYAWWELWPEFQRRIWGFSQDRQYIVVTDLANYFDSIPLSSLRDVVASQARIEQAVLDLLFFLLEAFIWRPEYIPLSGVGLPQIDFDAPRLLAHCYLFSADQLMKTATNGDYGRWMDDINFGVDSYTDARRLLGRLDNYLHMHGVRLNPGKTRILDADGAASHFLINENRNVTILANTLQNGARNSRNAPRIAALLRSQYESFAQTDGSGSRAKVLKRFLTLFGKLADPMLVSECPRFLAEEPEARDAVFRYYANLGYAPNRFAHIDTFLREHCTDDVSLFQAAIVLVSWPIPASSPIRGRVLELAAHLTETRGKSVSATAAGIWLFAKYASRARLVNYIRRTASTWLRSAWAARQVAAASPRRTPAQRQKLREDVAAAGLVEALQVLASLESIGRLRRLDRQLRMYLEHQPQLPYGYPFQKVLVALAVLDGQLLPGERRGLSRRLAEVLNDPVHVELIGQGNRKAS